MPPEDDPRDRTQAIPPVTLRELEERLYAWHVKRYGPGPINIERTFAKFIEEAGELAEALNAGDYDNARVEAADCAIVLMTIARGLDYSLEEAVIKKMATIERRLAEGKEKTLTVTARQAVGVGGLLRSLAYNGDGTCRTCGGPHGHAHDAGCEFASTIRQLGKLTGVVLRSECLYCGHPEDTRGLCTRQGCAGGT